VEGTMALIKMIDQRKNGNQEKEIEIVSTVVNLAILQETAENQEEMEEIEMIEEVEEDVATDLIPVLQVVDENILEVEAIVEDEGQGQIVETAIEREEVEEVIAEGGHILEVEIEEVVEVHVIDIVEVILEIKEDLILEIEDDLEVVIVEVKEDQGVKEEVHNNKVNSEVPEVDHKIKGNQVIQENNNEVRANKHRENPHLEAFMTKKMKNKNIHLKITDINLQKDKANSIHKKEIHLRKDSHNNSRIFLMKMALEITRRILKIDNDYHTDHTGKIIKKLLQIIFNHHP